MRKKLVLLVLGVAIFSTHIMARECTPNTEIKDVKSLRLKLKEPLRDISWADSREDDLQIYFKNGKFNRHWYTAAFSQGLFTKEFLRLVFKEPQDSNDLAPVECVTSASSISKVYESASSGGSLNHHSAEFASTTISRVRKMLGDRFEFTANCE